MVSWYEHRGVTLILGWSSVTVAVATYRPQRILGWGEQKAREPPSGSRLPHRAPGRIYPDQGSNRQRSDVSGRPRAVSCPIDLEECPQHSLCTPRTVETKGGERTHRPLWESAQRRRILWETLSLESLMYWPQRKVFGGGFRLYSWHGRTQNSGMYPPVRMGTRCLMWSL